MALQRDERDPDVFFFLAKMDLLFSFLSAGKTQGTTIDPSLVYLQMRPCLFVSTLPLSVFIISFASRDLDCGVQ